VFKISGASRYDDLIAERYHFPRIYLRAAEVCVGDWIIYRKNAPAGGRKAYVAAGLVHSIDPDPADRTLFYTGITDSIEFDRPVPYRDPIGHFLERMLRELDNPAIAGRDTTRPIGRARLRQTLRATVPRNRFAKSLTSQGLSQVRGAARWCVRVLRACRGPRQIQRLPPFTALRGCDLIR
jgi:hypothetical protein